MIVEAVIVGVFTSFLLWYYSKKHMKLYVKVSVWLGWYLSFSTVFMLPVDMFIKGYDELEEDPYAGLRLFL